MYLVKHNHQILLSLTHTLFLLIMVLLLLIFLHVALEMLLPYLEEMNKEKDLNLTYTKKIHIEPMGIYSEKNKSLDDLKDGAKISVPNDATNEARALQLLANNRIIEVADKELITAKDITKNPKNIEIVEVDAAQVPSTLQDVDFAVINTNFALNVGLNPTKDAIVIESNDSPYANILACREDNKDSIWRII